MLKVANILASGIYALTLVVVVLPAQVHALPPAARPIITEIKVRFDTNNPLDVDEFIEIYNPTVQDISLEGYTLEYFNAANPTPTQEPTSKPIATHLLGAGKHLALAKQPAQITNAIQLPLSSLADTGGRLRLVDAEGTIVDEIGWTNAQAQATTAGVYPKIMFQCTTTSAACQSRTQSIGRVIDEATQTYLLDAPQWALGVPTSQSSLLIEPALPVVPPAEELPPVVPEPVLPVVTCEGVVLSEILPNPAGSDTTHEFIELYNPTDETIVLDGCSLQTSANSKSFTFTDFNLLPGKYQAFADDVTGLTLTNSAGGTVWLLSPTAELQAIAYPADLDDDVSWALTDGMWQATYISTPSGINQLLAVKPCAEGQVRNVATSRCESSVVSATSSASTLALCKTGQERNPETNRCRNIVTAVSGLTPCKAGQERNAETNRCRAVLASSTLNDCPEGQERNPETNRCRKASAADGDTLAAVTDVKSNTGSPTPRWWLIAAVTTAVLGYAAYEWRHDVRNFVHGISNKLKKSRI